MGRNHSTKGMWTLQSAGSGFKSYLGPYLLSDLSEFLNLSEVMFSGVWKQCMRDSMLSIV